jgi:hypothetical protein
MQHKAKVCTEEYSLLHHRRIEYVLVELKVDTVEIKLPHYKQKWLNLVSRMESVRYPEQLLDY